MLIASLVLHHVKGVGAVTHKEINTECKTFDLHKLSFDNFRSSNGLQFCIAENQNYAEDTCSLMQ